MIVQGGTSRVRTPWLRGGRDLSVPRVRDYGHSTVTGGHQARPR